MKYVISVLPILVFIIILTASDSLKLVKMKWILACLACGLCAALVALYGNRYCADAFHLDFNTLSLYVAPAVEELLKSIVIFIMIRKSLIGFAIDGTIYGAAAGAGFACFENVFYLRSFSGMSTAAALVRGFGTAFMHSGCTAIVALVLVLLSQKRKVNATHWLLALIPAYLIHSAYNHLTNPFVAMVAVFFTLLILIAILFEQSDKSLSRWMDLTFAEEASLLSQIRKGTFSQTPSGEYLMKIRKHFSQEVVFDMYCYITLYLELELAAKRNMMCREAGIRIPPSKDADSKLRELKALRKRIGSGGLSALSPICSMRMRDLWTLGESK